MSGQRTPKSGRILAILGLLSALFLPTSQLQAQETGRIVGRVVEAGTARPISTAQVYTADQSVGTLTDVDGRFLLLNVPVGTVDIVAQIIGYATKTVTGIEVTPGQITTVNIIMESSAVQLEAITVTATREEGSAGVLLDQRRESESMVDAVGAVEIASSTASDAADVASRMTGVTVSEGKYVYVRGLGDRYSQTSFNGSSLPSPNPEKEVVPLDLFPSGFLESLSTQKSYTPDRPADFAGGTVEIETKKFPELFTLSVGMGTSFNDRSQFRDIFLTYDGGGSDWLGYDDGTRGLPEIVNTELGGLKGDRLPSDPAFRREAGLQFDRHFTPFLESTPLNRSFDVAVGGSAPLAGGDQLLGYFVAFNYSDSYVVTDLEEERKWQANAFDPTIDDRFRIPNVEYSFDRGTRNIAWGTLLNVFWNISPKHQVGIRTTYNLNSDDEARIYNGENNEDIGGIVRGERLRFQNRNLGWAQFTGEHTLFGESLLEWKLTGARAYRDEPGLRETIYLREGNNEGDPYFLERRGESGRYLWSELTDDDFSATVDWEFPFDAFGGSGALKFGGMARQRTRDFGARRFNWDFLSTTIQDDIEPTLEDDNNIVGNQPGPGQYALFDIIEPGDLYDAEDTRLGGYAMATIPAGERLEFIVGARVETYKLEMFGRDSLIASQDQVDVAPSLNVLYRLNDQMNLRAALSQTVNRPEFRELAPFQFTEASSLRQLFGNPDLISSTIQAADLRWDFFPQPWELISASAFYKKIQDPIEQTFIAAASAAFSYQNAREAELYGIELDGQVRLDRLSERLEAFSVNANFSWIESSVNVIETGTFLPTSLDRPLEGQAPYTLNVGVNWRAPTSGWEAGLFFNRVGETLTAAGGFGIPDIYQQPRNNVDASLRIPLPRNAYIRIKGTNLLDDEYEFTQSNNGITLPQRLFATGRTISVKLGWDIF